MRIAARTSSGTDTAPGDSPTLAARLEFWKTRLATTDWTPWLIIALGAFLRFFLLGIKPPHFDEGINGWFVDQMAKTGFYRYDPTNYHGPLHFYILFLSQTLFGRNIWALRLPVVLVSTLCLSLALKFESIVGRNTARLAALAMAVSPGCVFYGRYSIHEVWLQLFSMLFLLGLLGLWKIGTVRYLWFAGMGLTGMVLTKETYVIHFVCAALALPAIWLSHKINPIPDAEPARQTWTTVDLAVVVGAGIALLVFFYSGTFLHWSGLKGLYQTFGTWFNTGQNGNGHEKPFYYWLKLILRYELPSLIGLGFALGGLWIRHLSLRYLAICGLGTFVAYSIVHYKTPWCIISIAWPFLFLFGAAILAIPQNLRTLRYATASVALVASLGSAIWVNYLRCTTDTEPYVYVQTYNDIFKLTRPVLALAHRDPAYYQMTGHIIRNSTYPLPWMLGDFPRIGYYEHANLPDKLDADFLLVQEDRVAAVEKKLKRSYYTQALTIRSYQDPSKLYLNSKMFKSFFPERSPDFIGKSSR
jgi:uncharacterized protein (TIGR03663 family)